MSRWTLEYESSPFHRSWQTIISTLRGMEVDDKSIPADVEELARLKKAVAFVDELLKAIDPELVPRAVWANVQAQTEPCNQALQAYSAAKQAGLIQKANEHMDHILAYVRPYFVAPVEAIDALAASFQAHGRQLNSYATALHNASEQAVVTARSAAQKTASQLQKAEVSATKVDELYSRLLKGNGDTPSIEQQILEAQLRLNVIKDQAEKTYGQLFVGESSTTAKIHKLEQEISDTRTDLLQAAEAVDKELNQIGTFYRKIFGEEGPSGTRTGGLENELSTRTAQLTKLEEEQKVKHASLFQKIESLLPGATSAGLASAYKEMKTKFETSIFLYTLLFLLCIAGLVVGSLVSVVEQLTLSPVFSLKFAPAPEFDAVLRGLLYKAPLIAPVVWLAIFASTRRSQYERLQQEYAHKEAIAKSFESYKRQLQELKQESQALELELLSKAIDAIAYNASVTLDGKHEDKTPVQEFLSKACAEELGKLVETIAEAWKKTKG